MSKLKLYHSEIVDDYLNKNLSLRKLEKKYGINRTFIKSHLIQHGVPIKKHGKIPPHIQEKLDDRDWLESSYLKSLSCQSIANTLGVTKQCVFKYMKKHGIKTNSNNKPFLLGNPLVIDIVESPEYETTLEYTSTRESHEPRNPLLLDREWLLDNYKTCMSIQHIADLCGVSYPTAQNALHYHNIPIVKSGNISHLENHLSSKLRHLNPVQSYNIEGVELDLFFPEYNVAVEIHGIRFHSEIYGGKGRNYHQNKFEICKKHGIHLYQFWEFEVSANTDKVCGMITSKCGKSDITLYARNCQIEFDLDVGEFLNETHIQGAINYTKSISLTYNGEIVACMTFIKPRNVQYDWELNRFSVKSGHNIPGAFSRLLNYGPPGLIVSYSDCRYSSGGVYQVNGFEKVRTNGAIYYYTKDYKNLETRMKYQKSRIKEKFGDSYDPSLTEWENMKSLGFDRVWGCKTYTWIIRK